MEFKTSGFVSSPFQTYVCSKILASEEKATIVQLPTGSGKTFIAAIIAEYYRLRNKRVVVVTSEEFLVTQMRKMFGEFRQEIKIETMERALLNQTEYDIFILDEADACINDKGSTIDIAS